MSLGEGFNMDKIRRLPIVDRAEVGTEAARRTDLPHGRDLAGDLTGGRRFNFLDQLRKAAAIVSRRGREGSK